MTIIWTTRLPCPVVVAGAVSAAYAIRFTASVVVGPAPDALRSRVSKVPVLMRLPITLLAAACLAVGIRRALSTGQVNNLAVCAVLGQAGPSWAKPAIRHRDLARSQSGADAQPGPLDGGTLIDAMTRTRIRLVPEGPPLLPHLHRQRVFDRLMRKGAWVRPRRARGGPATERLQPPLPRRVTVQPDMDIVVGPRPCRNRAAGRNGDHEPALAAATPSGSAQGQPGIGPQAADTRSGDGHRGRARQRAGGPFGNDPETGSWPTPMTKAAASALSPSS